MCLGLWNPWSFYGASWGDWCWHFWGDPFGTNVVNSKGQCSLLQGNSGLFEKKRVYVSILTCIFTLLYINFIYRHCFICIISWLFPHILSIFAYFLKYINTTYFTQTKGIWTTPRNFVRTDRVFSWGWESRLDMNRNDRTRWWFQIFFRFIPKIGGRWTHFDEYFPDGLTPPTR